MSRANSANLRAVPDKTYPEPTISLLAEGSVLGAIMYEQDRLDDVAEIVTEEMFHDERHKAVWRAICALDDVDYLTVGEHLRAGGILDSIGGYDTLRTMIACTPAAENVQVYARIVAECYARRRAHDQAEALAARLAGRDPIDDVLTAAQTNLEDIGRSVVFTRPPTATDDVTEWLDEFKRNRELGSTVTGLPTGYAELDRITGGLQASDLIIVAGRSSMGKTVLAIGLAVNAAQTGKSVLVCSLEMPRKQLMSRIVSSLSGVPLSTVRAPCNVTDNEEERIVTAARWRADADNLVVLDTDIFKLSQIRAAAKRQQKEQGLDLLVIDYLQLISGELGDRVNRNDEMAHVSRSIKQLAKELDVPVVLLSQLNREVEKRTDKRPVLSDLRESGQIEQDADLVAFVYRDEYYNPDSTDKGLAEIILRKHRNGELATAKLKFDGECVRFSDHIPDRSMSGEEPLSPELIAELEADDRRIRTKHDHPSAKQPPQKQGGGKNASKFF